MTEIYTNTGNTKMALAKADEGIALAGNNKNIQSTNRIY